MQSPRSSSEPQLCSHHTQQLLYRAQDQPNNIHPTIRMCKNACNAKPLTTGITATPLVNEAVQAQAHLGSEFLLRGILDKRWMTAMSDIERDKPLVRMTLYTLDYGKYYFDQYGNTQHTSPWQR